jgi:hypothetical protein
MPGRTRQARDLGNLFDRRGRRFHLMDRSDLLVGDPPSPSLLRAAPGLTLASRNLLPSVNTLRPALGLILGD